MTKYKAHFKNQTENRAYDHNFDAKDFVTAYDYACNMLTQLEEQFKGWRMIGVYEILYDAEKLSRSIH
jgi:hypothetical protein